jgi:hypothetical protein
VSSNLDVLQDRLAPGSFGLLVDFDYNTVVISPEVVNRIYPALRGRKMRESRTITMEAF